MNPIRTVLAGFGLGGQVFHAPHLVPARGFELAAVVTTHPDRRAAAASQLPAVPVAGSLTEALASGDIDLVVISTTNRTHEALALEALAAGAAVVVDKPIAPTVEAAERMVAAAEVSGRPFSVFQNRRFDDDWLALRSCVADGTLGHVLRLESRFERWRPAVDRDRWREQPDPDEGGGLLLDLQSHLVDQAVSLLGPPERVWAEVRTCRPEARVDDDTFVALEHHGGAVSHLWASMVAPGDLPRFVVRGTRGAFISMGLDPQEPARRDGLVPSDPGWPGARGATIVDDRGSTAITMPPGDHGRFYDAMAAALLDGAPVPVTGAEAVLTLRVIEAARRAASERRVVELAG